jgi:hypothetical protein
MAIVRFDGSKPLKVPEGMDFAPVSGARVHLCLLSLDAKKGTGKEIPLAISDTLPPLTALRRAWTVYRSESQKWGKRQVAADPEQLAKRWPEAFAKAKTLGNTEGLLLAIRVLWDAGEVVIPGPGGLAIRALSPKVANQRLLGLYDRP